MRHLRALWRRAQNEDGGSAVVEFIGVTVILLLPLVYLILTLGRVQAAAFAAEAAARESGRVLSQTEDLATAVAQAQAAVGLAFEDHGLSVDPATALSFTCSDEPCLTPAAQINVEVSAAVRLPLIPDFMAGALPLEVPIEATHLAVVPEFRGAA